MNLEKIKEILNKEKMLLKNRDEILYSKFNLECQKKSLEEQIRKGENVNAEYREFKSDRLQELVEKIGCISVVSLASYVALKEMSSDLASRVLSCSFFTYFFGLVTLSYKIEIDEYKSSSDSYYKEEEIQNLEAGFNATKLNLEEINEELSNNSKSLTDIYNQISNISEDEPKKLVKEIK